jgi:hypothetical protein
VRAWKALGIKLNVGQFGGKFRRYAFPCIARVAAAAAVEQRAHKFEFQMMMMMYEKYKKMRCL